jgi:hypothetical protein
MKWESVVAGIAALGGLILVTKTPVVEKEAETVVFNARALPQKIRIEQTQKEIKSPILKQIVTDNSSYDFSFNSPEFKYPKRADGNWDYDKPIGIVFYGQNQNQPYKSLSLNYEKCITKGSLFKYGYSKAWCGNYMNDKEVSLASSAPVLKQMKAIGIDVGTSQFTRSYPYRDNGSEVAIVNKLLNARLPSIAWTKQKLEEALTNEKTGKLKCSQDTLDAFERIFINKQPIDVTTISEYQGYGRDSLRAHLSFLGRYIWNSLSESEQFEKELDYRVLFRPSISNHALTGNLAWGGDYSRRRHVFGKYTLEQKKILMKYWMIAQNLAVHEGYDLWTKAWVDRGMDTSQARIVKNIRYGVDLYTTGRGIPGRNNGVASILSYDDLNTSFYSEKEITKIYLKNRNLFESTKRSMQAQIQPVLDANLGGASSDSKQRLIDALTPPYFSNYEQAYFKNRPVKDVDDYSWNQIVSNITADVVKAKDSLSEQERKDIQAAWENRMQAGERKMETRINGETAIAVDDLNQKIVKRRQAGQKRIANGKQGIENRIKQMKEKLGL